MKKIILYAVTTIAILSMMSFAVTSKMERHMGSYKYASAFKSITVYKITMVGRNGAASK
ncbi:MAG: hypothetical protein K2J00_03300 [Bacteroidaceae bacterium]|nr:hypothetical protein [Bacteroidaceae bacterium]